MSKVYLFIAATLFTVFAHFSSAQEAEPVTKRYSPEQRYEMGLHNNRLKLYRKRDSTEPLRPIDPNARPFAEYENNKFIIMSAENFFNSNEVKRSIAKNLPADVTLVIYTHTDSSSEKERLLNTYKDVISEDRILVVYVPGDLSKSFWARDSLPVPVIFKNSTNLRLVNAKYYYYFEPDVEIAKIFSAQLVSHDFYYEGGNFMPNRLGDCVVINSDLIPSDEIFKSDYACKQIIRLRKVKGIGHIDESVKFLDDKVVITDTPSYVEPLTKAGYTVHTLPQPLASYGTYVNALLVNNVLFLPIYGEASDQIAIDTYEKLGYKVVPIRTNQLSSQGMGSIHCITMNYPASKLSSLLKSMNGQLL